MTVLDRSDKAKGALDQARQTAWDLEAADRFERREKAQLGNQTHGSSVMNILNSLVGAGEAVGAMAAESLHAAADEVTALAHAQTQPPTRPIDRQRRRSMLGLKR